MLIFFLLLIALKKQNAPSKNAKLLCSFDRTIGMYITISRIAKMNHR